MSEEGKNGKIDLNTVINRSVAAITLDEHDDDRKIRLDAQRRAQIIEDYKGIVVFGLVILALVSATIVAAYKSLFDPSASAETQRWGQTILASLVTSSISFVVGRKIGGK